MTALVKSQASREGVRVGGIFGAFGCFGSIALLNMAMGVRLHLSRGFKGNKYPTLILVSTLVLLLVASISTGATHSSMKSPTKSHTLNYTAMAGAASGLVTTAFIFIILAVGIPAIIWSIDHDGLADGLEESKQATIKKIAGMVDEVVKHGVRHMVSDHTNFVAMEITIVTSIAMFFYLVAGGLSVGIVFGAGAAESEGMIEG